MHSYLLCILRVWEQSRKLCIFCCFYLKTLRLFEYVASVLRTPNFQGSYDLGDMTNRCTTLGDNIFREDLGVSTCWLQFPITFTTPHKLFQFRKFSAQRNQKIRTTQKEECQRGGRNQTVEQVNQQTGHGRQRQLYIEFIRQ